MELPEKAVNFSLVVQTFRGQKVIREGASRILWRIFFDISVDKEHPITSFALTSNPVENKEISASWTPCPDDKALERGKEKEDKSYLEPDMKGWWNRSKATPSHCRQLVSGKATFYIINDFWKFLLNSKYLKGIFTLTRQNSSDLWIWKKSAGPGEKKD